MTVTFFFSAFICKTGSEGFCTIKNYVWNIPVTFDAGGSDHVALSNVPPYAFGYNPYPSPITVSGLTGQVITNLRVVFNNLSHTAPDNIDAMVIALGTAVIILVLVAAR